MTHCTYCLAQHFFSTSFFNTSNTNTDFNINNAFTYIQTSPSLLYFHVYCSTCHPCIYKA